ncbi:MAG: fasciclin domain-containing protein [Bacteroidaceae bacterium]|nr:fasciclin domain-containing protein [Bacteroidaceae bacterium]
MKIKKRLIRKSALVAVVTVLIGMATACTDLWSEQHPGTYYISDGKTIATYLEEYQDIDGTNPFTDLIYILKKDINGSNYWGELKTYGDRTLFAPTNAAFDEYLKERKDLEKDPEKKKYFDNIQSVPDSILDSIRKTHLCKESIYLDDLRKNEDGSLPASNMLNRYLTYKAIEDRSDSTQVRVAYTINQFSKITVADDSTVNGVVQIIDHVIRQSTAYIPGYLRENNKKTEYSSHQGKIFLKALELTKLSVELEKYRDDSYPEPKYDSTITCLEMTGKAAVEYETGYQNFKDKTQQRVVWPDQRLFKYTLFVVSDSILEVDYNITDADVDGVPGKITNQIGISLRSYAKQVYNDDHKDDNDTLSTSALYRLMSYHILPCWLKWDMLNFRQEDIVKGHTRAGGQDSIDMEDFYETLHPYAIMRISTPYDPKLGDDAGKKIYINRKGTLSANNLTHEGVRIWNSSESSEIETNDAMNGGYYFVDKLLLFDDDTKDALDTRIRVMGQTLSPDFINSGARGRMRTDAQGALGYAVYTFKRGFCKNVDATDQSLFVVRYEDKTYDIMFFDEMNLVGIYDVSLRLPPVPKTGLYEIRIFGNAQADDRYKYTRGIVQFYLHEGKPGDEDIKWTSWDWHPCDIPVNMATMTTEPKIGNIKDSDLKGDTDEETELNIQGNDKAMRNRGYMKAPASFAMGDKVSDRLRNHDVCFRKIICTEQLTAGKDYYLRFRETKDQKTSICPVNFIEIVPKSVFAGAIPEDRM